MGIFPDSIARTCTDEVWVRSEISGFFSIKKVSCISLAGCSAGKFRAVKLCQSSSISGPSETVKPIFEKTSIILFLIIDKGCREPSWIKSAGRLRSFSEDEGSSIFSKDWFKELTFPWILFFKSFRCWPISFLNSLGTSLNSVKSPETIPFYRI